MCKNVVICCEHFLFNIINISYKSYLTYDVEFQYSSIL